MSLSALHHINYYSLSLTQTGRASNFGKMASSNVRLLAALCSLAILISFIGNTQSASCCMRYTRRPLPYKQIMGYTIQTINNSCDINAIIFHVPGKFICADPSMKRTQQRMKFVDEMRHKKALVTKERTSTSG
ncbi:C-C motif chemokine 20b [Lates calcarifer]|uniref:C-C motif chemokine 20b n=2 Tax=Lates calcarifer TaxID=8187 RepID=A0AAJ7LYT5_LATCA|nr:C-C motif chemokine 20b [Lates calcarifer]